MTPTSRLSSGVLAALTLAAGLPAQGVSTGASKYVKVELVPEVESVRPGAPFWVGFRLQMAPEWHTYWLNPGDSGLPTRMKWALPEGWSASPFRWPYPGPISLPPLMSYGYEGEVLLLSEITPPPTLAAGEVKIGGRLDWLECKDVCLPGKAELDVTLPVRDEPPPAAERVVPLFAEARRRLPGDAAGWNVQVHTTPQAVSVSFQAPAALRAARFYPEQSQVIEYAAPQTLLRTADGYRIETRPAANGGARETLAGVLVLEEAAGTRAVRFEARPQALAGSLPPGTPVAQAPGASASAPGIGVPLALVFAFAGGLILNLMPCVLPVLSLKVFSFVRQANGDRKAGLRHGAAYTLGVLLSFWALAGLLLALRAGGEQIGWGFQLQSPAFVVFLACLFFLIGLNLFGVFEVGMSLTTVGGAVQTRGDLFGSFAGGALATIVATPCTAPFMGSALGFALSQPAVAAMAIFTALGLGMAAPYLLLSAAPGLTRFLPRPGAWMESFKQLMGFFMMGAVVVLLWVFGRQAGVDAVAALLAALVILGLAAWTYGRGSVPSAPPRTRRLAVVTAVVLLAAGLFVGFTYARPDPEARRGDGTLTQGSIEWQPWSPERVAGARASGKPVFVDFTAAWCLSCQVNERVAFGSAEVQERFRLEGIVALRADWTRRDDAITQALASYGRSGVPLYVLYGRGKSEPYLLPEVISPGIVLSALDRGL